MKTYRFFYHYFKAKHKMSVHWRGACYVVDDIKCHVPCEIKWRKSQPMLVMQGFAHDLKIKDNIAHVT